VQFPLHYNGGRILRSDWNDPAGYIFAAKPYCTGAFDSGQKRTLPGKRAITYRQKKQGITVDQLATMSDEDIALMLRGTSPSERWHAHDFNPDKPDIDQTTVPPACVHSVRLPVFPSRPDLSCYVNPARKDQF